MNPYDVLGVPPAASDEEIKSAYRKAVKLHHPDKTGFGDTTTIAAINEAYDILSNPERKRLYDQGYQYYEVFVEEEDPREAYRREFLRRKAEESRARKEAERKIFTGMYRLNKYIAVLALLFVIDELLPTISYVDRVVDEWTVVRRVKRQSFSIFYLKTEHFTFSVPAHSEGNRQDLIGETINVEASPIFRIPVYATITFGGKPASFEPSRTVFSFAIPFHFVILGAALTSLAFRQHTHMAYSISFAPPLLLLLTIAMFLFFG